MKLVVNKNFISIHVQEEDYVVVLPPRLEKEFSENSTKFVLKNTEDILDLFFEVDLKIFLKKSTALIDKIGTNDFPGFILCRLKDVVDKRELKSYTETFENLNGIHSMWIDEEGGLQYRFKVSNLTLKYLDFKAHNKVISHLRKKSLFDKI